MSDSNEPCICKQIKSLGTLQTAKLHGLCLSTMYQKVRQCHPQFVRVQTRRNRPKDIDMDECAKRYTEGWCLSRLSAEYGITLPLLRKALGEAGVYKPGPYRVGVRKPPAREVRQVPRTVKLHVAAKQQWRCYDCKEPLEAIFELDHPVPLHRFGTNSTSNLAAKCSTCHSKKSARERLESIVESIGYTLD